MYIKIIFLSIIFFTINSTSVFSQKKLLKAEAKNYCKCYQTFNKKKRKLERKVEKDSKSKKYKPGDKLFGGYTLDFSFEKCVSKKRSRKAKKYIATLDEKGKKKFDNKAQNTAKTRCPKIKPKFSN